MTARRSQTLEQVLLKGKHYKNNPNPSLIIQTSRQYSSTVDDYKVTAKTMWSGKPSSRCALHHVLQSPFSLYLVLSPFMWKGYMPGRQHNDGK